MKQIFYSTERAGLREGQDFRNPRFFSWVEPGVSKVVIDGNWPAIAAAYEKAGVAVEIVGPKPFQRPASPLPPPPAIDANPDVIAIPDNWKSLPWWELRALARKFRNVPVINKEQAISTIEAELERRSIGNG